MWINLQYCNYHRVAEGYGARGLLLDKSCESKITEVRRFQQF